MSDSPSGKCQSLCGDRRCDLPVPLDKKWCQQHYRECVDNIYKYHYYGNQLRNSLSPDLFDRFIRMPDSEKAKERDQIREKMGSKWIIVQDWAQKALEKRLEHRKCILEEDSGHKRAIEILSYFAPSKEERALPGCQNNKIKKSKSIMNRKIKFEKHHPVKVRHSGNFSAESSERQRFFLEDFLEMDSKDSDEKLPEDPAEDPVENSDSEQEYKRESKRKSSRKDLNSSKAFQDPFSEYEKELNGQFRKAFQFLGITCCSFSRMHEKAFEIIKAKFPQPLPDVNTLVEYFHLRFKLSRCIMFNGEDLPLKKNPIKKAVMGINSHNKSSVFQIISLSIQELGETYRFVNDEKYEWTILADSGQDVKIFHFPMDPPMRKYLDTLTEYCSLLYRIIQKWENNRSGRICLREKIVFPIIDILSRYLSRVNLTPDLNDKKDNPIGVLYNPLLFLSELRTRCSDIKPYLSASMTPLARYFNCFPNIRDLYTLIIIILEAEFQKILEKISPFTGRDVVSFLLYSLGEKLMAF